jgi:hypothetical protein
MRKWLLAAVALAILPMVGCDKPTPIEAAANIAADPAADPADGLVVEPVDPTADPGLGPPPHPKPKPGPPHKAGPHPKPKPHPKPIGHKPKGYFHPYKGHPFHGGMHGPWAKHWLGHHHHGHHYLYGVYSKAWRGYTHRVWNERWLYWSPDDYCWYRYDEEETVFIPLDDDGTDAFDSEPPPPPPPPPDN